MMKALLRPTLTVAVLSLLLAFVYQQSRSVNIERIQGAQQILIKIESLESLLGRDMLKIRNGDIVHYDTLNYGYKKLFDLNTQLGTRIPQESMAFYADLKLSLLAQNRYIEQFMADQSVLSNSLRYLPRALALAVAKNPQHELALTILHRDTLDYLHGSNPKLADKIRETLKRTQSAVYVHKHLENILNRNQSALHAITSSEGVGVQQHIQVLNQSLEDYLETGVSRMEAYQAWLMLITIILTAYIGWVVWQQTNVANKLRKAVRFIEAQKSALDEHAIVAITDQCGDIIYVNDKFCDISGYSRDELMNKNHRLLNSALHSDDFFKQMWHTIASGQTWHGVIRNCCKDGSFYWVDTSIVSFLNDEGKPYQYVSIRTDVTRLIEQEEEQRQHQKKLEHAQRLESLGVLAGGIAHDFNNLLTAIMGNAGLIDRTMEPGSPAKDKLQRVISASEKAASLCKQMLAYSGKGHFIIQECDMSALVEDVAELLLVSIDKNVELKHQLAKDLPAIEADVSQMHQIIMNLITNANEAIHGNSGTITVSTGCMHADRSSLDNMICVQKPYLPATLQDMVENILS